MFFCDFVEVLFELENISARNEITSKLASLFGNLNAKEAQNVSYLLQGELGPAYLGKRFALGNSQVKNFLNDFYQEKGVDVEEFFLHQCQIFGDLGKAVYQTEEHFNFNAEKSLVDLSDFFHQLSNLAAFSGTGSVQDKKLFFITLFKSFSPKEKLYLVKIVLCQLRLGFSTISLLEAFSIMYQGDKKLKALLEQNYNVHADLGLIIHTLKLSGLEELKNPKPILGIPVIPAASERAGTAQDVLDRMSSFALEPKLDGLRAQVHKFFDHSLGKNVVKIFSRNLLDMSSMFPEISQAILNLPDIDFILDGEVVGTSLDGLDVSFQQTSQRRRKHGVANASAETPVKYHVFDILMFNGQSLLNQSYVIRRNQLESFLKNVSSIIFMVEQSVFNNPDMSQAADFIHDHFARYLELGYEGGMAKNLEGNYQAGKRGFNWLKIKNLDSVSRLKDSVDVVIVGGFKGQGRRAAFGLGAVLVAVLNKETTKLETLAKVGAGFSDQGLKDLFSELSNFIIDQPCKELEVSKDLKPDFWVEPKVVLEVIADDISLSLVHTALRQNGKGFALRFPRALRVRKDKLPSEVTTSQEIPNLRIG